MISIEKIIKAISYLIKISQLDKTDSIQKVELAKSLGQNDLDILSHELYELYTSNKSKLLKTLNDKSRIEIRPKHLKNADRINTDATNAPSQLSGFDDYTFYFRLPFEAAIYEILWIMEYGEIIDSKLSHHVYANRLELSEKYLFKNYWRQYTKWREDGFSDTLLTRNKKNKSVISFDLKKFYHSIFVKNIPCIDESIDMSFINEIWRAYDKKISYYNNNYALTLPIGPLSSGLFSNLVLSEFDKKTAKLSNVIFYGRYVDDIIIVIEKEKNEKTDISIFSSQQDDYRKIISNNNDFIFNNDKTKIYEYDLNHPFNIFEAVSKLIDRTTSEWRFAPDIDFSEYEFTKEITYINPDISIRKPRSFSDVEISESNLKIQLAKYLIELSAIDYIPTSKINDIEKTLDFAFSGTNSIKFFQILPQLFTVLKILNKSQLIKKVCQTIADNLEATSNNRVESACKSFLFDNILSSYLIACANSQQTVNRQLFGYIKSKASSKLKYFNERRILEILKWKLERKLLFNKAKNFQECADRYDFEFTSIIQKNLTNQHEVNAEKIQKDVPKIIGKNGKIKIAIAHINVPQTNFINALKGKRKSTIQDFKNIIKPINDAIEAKAHLICFPEISIPERLLSVVIEYSRLKNLPIIGGIEHCKYDGIIGNFIFFSIPTKPKHTVYLRPKIHYAPAEKEKMQYYKIDKAWSTNEFPIINFLDASTAIFNCFELADIELRAKTKGFIDFASAIEFNYDLSYFSNIIESFTRDNHCYCIQANAGQIGENRVTAPLSQHHMNLIRFKAGENAMAITTKIDISTLRKFHNGENVKFDKNLKIEFKKLPPGFIRKQI